MWALAPERGDEVLDLRRLFFSGRLFGFEGFAGCCGCAGALRKVVRWAAPMTQFAPGGTARPIVNTTQTINAASAVPAMQLAVRRAIARKRRESSS